VTFSGHFASVLPHLAPVEIVVFVVFNYQEPVGSRIPLVEPLPVESNPLFQMNQDSRHKVKVSKKAIKDPTSSFPSSF